ncbi:MAG TPA: hypothetical protein VGR28_11420 [Candidatus Thermoplasmatota archaeon]|jgi:hypothetical protein|nr:hypothetical protein [Candidatus Thermoplasmatota archaeon]
MRRSRALLALLLAAPALAVPVVPLLGPAPAPLASVAPEPAAAAFDHLACPWPLPALEPLRPLEHCNVRATAQTGPANEIDLAMDPTDPLHLVAVAKGYNYTRQMVNSGLGAVNTPYATTFDGGLTWAEGYLQPMSTVLVSLPVLGEFGRTATTESDPIVEFTRSGKVLANTLRVEPGDYAGLPNYRSEDGGVTFTEISMAYEGGTDKQWFVSDPKTGNLYLITAYNGLGFTRSTDEGLTWSPMKSICGCSTGGIDVGPDGVLHVIGVAGDGIVHRRSLDGGATWSPQKRIATHHGAETNPFNLRVFRTINIPQIAASRADGGVYVVWADHPDGVLEQACDAVAGSGIAGCPFLPDTNIYITRSADAGLMWSAPIRVDDDVLSDATMQFMPQVAVSPNGRDVHVAWMDQRQDPSGATMTAWYAHSGDFGATWGANLEVSELPSAVVTSHHQAMVPLHTGIFVGDYIGLQASDDRAVVAFPDTRYGRADVFVATVV